MSIFLLVYTGAVVVLLAILLVLNLKIRQRSKALRMVTEDGRLPEADLVLWRDRLARFLQPVVAGLVFAIGLLAYNAFIQ